MIFNVLRSFSPLSCSFILTFTLTSCTEPFIEKPTSLFNQNQVCSLKKFPVTQHSEFFSSAPQIEMDIQHAKDTDYILIKLNVSSHFQEKRLPEKTTLLLKIYSDSSAPYDISLPSKIVNNKNTLVPLSKSCCISFKNHTQSYAWMMISKSQFRKLQYAKKIIFELQTQTDVLREELNFSELEPLRVFIQECLENDLR